MTVTCLMFFVVSVCFFVNGDQSVMFLFVAFVFYDEFFGSGRFCFGFKKLGFVCGRAINGSGEPQG